MLRSLGFLVRTVLANWLGLTNQLEQVAQLKKEIERHDRLIAEISTKYEELEKRCDRLEENYSAVLHSAEHYEQKLNRIGVEIQHNSDRITRLENQP